MKYVMDNKSSAIKSIKSNDISALEVKSKNENDTLKIKKVLLVGTELKDSYIKNKINKKMISILENMKHILESDDTSDGTVSIVLDEIQRLKSIVINKYREHLIEEEYKALLKRIILTEEDFKRKFNARQIYKELMMKNLNEKVGKGR